MLGTKPRVNMMDEEGASFLFCDRRNRSRSRRFIGTVSELTCERRNRRDVGHEASGEHDGRRRREFSFLRSKEPEPEPEVYRNGLGIDVRAPEQKGCWARSLG